MKVVASCDLGRVPGDVITHIGGTPLAEQSPAAIQLLGFLQIGEAKLQVLNTALMSAVVGLEPGEARGDSSYYGRLVESCVGAHVANAAASGECELFSWRDGNAEVDFVVRMGRTVTAIEVKSGERARSLGGMDAFVAAHAPQRTLLVGAGDIALEEFLSRPVREWCGPRGAGL